MPFGKYRKRNRAGAAGLVVVVASVLVMTSSTAAQGADAAAICTGAHPGGLKYTKTVEGWPLPVPGGGGEVFLFYEGTQGYNCAVTVGNVNGSTYMDIGLRRSDGGGTPDWDSGNFSEYAGPVYVQAEGICVDVTGAVGDQSLLETGTNCGA